jgi:hypothetical protein
MRRLIRFTGDVFEEDASSEVFVEMEEAILRGLNEEGGTNPC